MMLLRFAANLTVVAVGHLFVTLASVLSGALILLIPVSILWIAGIDKAVVDQIFSAGIFGWSVLLNLSWFAVCYRHKFRIYKVLDEIFQDDED